MDINHALKALAESLAADPTASDDTRAAADTLVAALDEAKAHDAEVAQTYIQLALSEG